MRSIASIIFIAVMIWPFIGAADIIYFKDGMRTICQGRAWEEKDEVKCDYDGVILTYRREDVEHIHQTIVSQESDEEPTSEGSTTPAAPEELQPLKPISNAVIDGPAFYNPRRPYKYWSSNSAKHHTYQDAVEALAREFGRPSRWIEERIGTTNDLEKIREGLAQPEEPSETVQAPSPANQPVSGILFYNPRREYKYQLSANQKYHTYAEAIAALALEYQSTPQWVEDNMGPNNDMAAIRESLSRAEAENEDGHK